MFYFPVICFVAAIIYFCQFMEFGVPKLINNHFNDFVCIPIVLKICQYAVRYIKSNQELILPVFLQLCVTSIFCVYFEYVLPKYNSRYTGDSLDVVMYLLGMLFFLIIEQPSYLRKFKTVSSLNTIIYWN